MSNPTQFTWVDPTLNTDGSAVTPGEITGYTIGVRPSTGTAGTYPVTLAAPAGATSALLSAISPPLTSGAYAAAIKADTAVTTSAWSTEADFTLVEVPNPPTGFTVS